MNLYVSAFVIEFCISKTSLLERVHTLRCLLAIMALRYLDAGATIYERVGCCLLSTMFMDKFSTSV